jgi:hypothetical protein
VVHKAWKELIATLYGGLPKEEQPMFSWNAKTTGRAQGFMENESRGKLQDLLEFFNHSRDNVHDIVRLAHDRATISARQPQPQDAILPAGSIDMTGHQETNRPLPRPRPVSPPVTDQQHQIHTAMHPSAAQPTTDGIWVNSNSFDFPAQPWRSLGLSELECLEAVPTRAFHSSQVPLVLPLTIPEETPTSGFPGGVGLALPTYSFEDWHSLATTVVEEPFADPTDGRFT